MLFHLIIIDTLHYVPSKNVILFVVYLHRNVWRQGDTGISHVLYWTHQNFTLKRPVVKLDFTGVSSKVATDLTIYQTD